MKANTTLSIDTEIMALIKGKHINLSGLVENIFRNELKLNNQENPIDELKLINAQLSSELNFIKSELEKAKKEVEEWKNKQKKITSPILFRG